MVFWPPTHWIVKGSYIHGNKRGIFWNG
jgi:hypothetical protein